VERGGVATCGLAAGREPVLCWCCVVDRQQLSVAPLGAAATRGCGSFLSSHRYDGGLTAVTGAVLVCDRYRTGGRLVELVGRLFVLVRNGAPSEVDQ
jgi:hypothetical protein